MKAATRIASLCIGIGLALAQAAAQDQPAYETDPGVLKEVATGGLPMGRWKEGLTFDGVDQERTAEA